MSKQIPIKELQATQKDCCARSVSEADSFFKTLLENAFDGIGLIGMDGVVKYHSPSARRILGYENDMDFRESIFDLLHPDDIEPCRQLISSVVAQREEKFSVIIRFKHANGDWRYMETHLKLCRGENVNGVVINFRDVTEKIIAEKNLVESETFYKSLIENSFDGIVIINTGGYVKYHSPSLLRILGYRPASGVGKSILELLHPDDHALFHKYVPEVKKQAGKLSSAIVRFKHKNGNWVILETRLANCLEQPGIEGILINYRDISESEKIKSELVESEERFRSLFETAPEAIFLVETESGKIIDVNRKATELSGFSRKQLLNMKGIELSPHKQPDGSDSLKIIREKIEEAFSGANPVYEWHHRTADGRLIPCEVRITHFPPYDKKIIRGTVVDITARKKIEKQLKESEERYRNFTEAAPETIFIVDAEKGKFIDFNENALKLFGYSKEQLLKMKGIHLSPRKQPDGKDSLAEARRHLKKALSGEKPVYEWYHKDANGRVFPTETRLVRFPPYDKKILRGTVIDITERKKIEETLREQEKLYRHLTAVSPVGIFKSDIHGKTTFVNEKWCEITGISKKDALGNGWQKALHPDDRRWALKDWRNKYLKRLESKKEFRFMTPDGKVTWVYGQAVPDIDEKGNIIGYVGSVTDITERIEAEHALLQSEQRNSALLNAVPDMFFRVARDGTFLEFKAAVDFPPMMPPENFIGKKISETLPPFIAKPAQKALEKVFKYGTAHSFEYSIPLPDGNDAQAHFEARIVSVSAEEALILVRDFTKQREAENLLKNSEERWRSLVASAPLYIITLNHKDEITFINDEVGLDPAFYNGVSLFDFIRAFGLDESVIRKALAKTRKGKQNEIEIAVPDRNDREAIWFNVRGAPIRRNGKIEDIIVMALDITERKKVEQELKQSNEKLKTLYHRLETVREEEKRNIAMEIHDELGQELTAMKLGLFWLQQYFEKYGTGANIKTVRDKVISLIELSGQTIISVRKLSHQLRPVVLDNLGLIPAIEWQVQKVNESSSVDCIFEQELGDLQFPKDFSVSLFRIIQESLTNILRHSRATKANISLKAGGKSLFLEIRDNGTGIKAEDMMHPDKIGLFSMKERVQSWNGEFNIEGAEGRGTKISIIFSLNTIQNNHDTSHTV